MRCLTLAGDLRERGAGVSFVSRQHTGDLCGLIEDRGFPVRRLPVPVAMHAGGGASIVTLLRESWHEDAHLTRAAIEASGENPDWLIVDHYAFDRSWENAMRTSAGRIMVIDDLADREHDCDLLLDQNLVAGMHA